MANRTVARRSAALLASLVLLLIAGAAVLVGAWSDRGSRSSGPEGPVTAYASAIGHADLGGALDQLLPGLRDRSSSFVQWQLGNRYNILESAVRTSSPMDQILGRANVDRAIVVVTMEIEGKGNPRWRTTEELPVERVDGRWYLAKTPLELPN